MEMELSRDRKERDLRCEHFLYFFSAYWVYQGEELVLENVLFSPLCN